MKSCNFVKFRSVGPDTCRIRVVNSEPQLSGEVAHFGPKSVQNVPQLWFSTWVKFYFFPANQATIHILQFIIFINSYLNQITRRSTRFSFIYWGVPYFVFPYFVRNGLSCMISDLCIHKITAPTMNSGYGFQNFIF